MNITEELIKEIRSANRVISIPMVPRGLSVTRIHQVSNKLLHKVLEMNGDIELLSGTNIICQPGDVLIDNHRTLWKVLTSPVLSGPVKKVYDGKVQMKDAANRLISSEQEQDIEVTIDGEYHVFMDSTNRLAYVANRFDDDILMRFPEFKVNKDWTYKVTPPGKEQFIVDDITSAYISGHPGWSVIHPGDMVIIKERGSNNKWTVTVDNNTGKASILKLVEPPKKDVIQKIQNKPVLNVADKKLVSFIGISQSTNEIFISLKDSSIYVIKFDNKYEIVLVKEPEYGLAAMINVYKHGEPGNLVSDVGLVRDFYYHISEYLQMPFVESIVDATILATLRCDKSVVTSTGRFKLTVYDYQKTLALTVGVNLIDVCMQNSIECSKLNMIMVVQKKDQFYLVGLHQTTINLNDTVEVLPVDDFIIETSYTTDDLMDAPSISKLRYNYKDDVVYFEFGNNHVLLSINTPEWKKVFTDSIESGYASIRAEISSSKNPKIYTDMLAKCVMLTNYVILNYMPSNTSSNILIRCIQPYVTLTEYVEEICSFKLVSGAINEDMKTMVGMALPNILVAVFDTAFTSDMSKIKQIKIVRATGRGKYYLIDNSDDISNSHIYLLEGKPKVFDVNGTKHDWTPNNVKDKEIIIGEDDSTSNNVEEPRPFIVTNDGRKLYIANVKQRRNTKTIYSLNDDRKLDITNVIDKTQLDEDQELDTTPSNVEDKMPIIDLGNVINKNQLEEEQLPQDEVGKRGKFAEFISDKFNKIN